MADSKKPVERKVVKASTGEEKTVAEAKVKTAEKKGSAAPLRIFAVVCWLLGIACEVLAVLMLKGTMYVPAESLMTWLIAALAVDLVFVIIGSQLWKKANHIDPVSEKNKVKFTLWNNMGVIASVIAFAPIIILFLKDKDLDPKTKKIVTVVAAAALLVAGASSVDYNPVSSEELAAAEDTAVAQGVDAVYWTRFGSSYHLDPDCQTLKRSSTIFEGTIDEAFAANRSDPCDFCALEFAEQVEEGVDAALEPAA